MKPALYDTEYNKGNMPDKYQECTLAVDYKGPRYCAEMLTGVFIGNPAKARVLDIAAGTGKRLVVLLGAAIYNKDDDHIINNNDNSYNNNSSSKDVDHF